MILMHSLVCVDSMSIVASEEKHEQGECSLARSVESERGRKPNRGRLLMVRRDQGPACFYSDTGPDTRICRAQREGMLTAPPAEAQLYKSLPEVDVMYQGLLARQHAVVVGKV